MTIGSLTITGTPTLCCQYELRSILSTVARLCAQSWTLNIVNTGFVVVLVFTGSLVLLGLFPKEMAFNQI